jgi:hypothetical protein
MELVTEPDTYMPSMDNSGNYIDNIPPIKHGIRCPCGSRKDKSYDSHSLFAGHIKTKLIKNGFLILHQPERKMRQTFYKKIKNYN